MLVLTEKPAVLRLGHVANTDHLWQKNAVKFAKEVKKRTNGTVKVKIFPKEKSK